MLKKLVDSYPVLTLCLIFLLILLPNLEVLDVTIMEARNFITAREMLTDNNWLLTTMNGEARYEKPPLPTWLTAISAAFFGVKSVFAMRLPAALFVILLVVFVFKISRGLTQNNTFAFRNALIAGSSFYIIGIIIEAPWDIFTHGFMCVTIYFLFQFLEQKKFHVKYAFLASLFIGCSFLSKGPVSLYALLLPFLLAYGFTFKYKPLPKKLIAIVSILVIGILIGGWWYLYVRAYDPETFAAITEKETGNWSSYNVRPFYYYWSFFTQSGIWTIPAFISLLYPYLKSRVKNLKAYQFSLLWTLLAVILLSLIPEKKSRYLMPVLIPLSINISFYINYLITEFKTLQDKRETLPVYFNFGLIGLIGIIYAFIVGWLLKDSMEGYFLYFIISGLILFGIGILIFKNLRKKELLNVFYLTFGLFATLLITALPLKNALISDTYKPISELKQQSDLNLYQFNYIAPEVIWQYGDKIPPIKLKDGSIEFPKEDTFGLLAIGISPEDAEYIQSLYQIEEQETFDLNQVSSNSRQYKERLQANYYILTKQH
ncbi:ArnT family glycosyltransferase [Hanstruepera ponticola]|uniref:ArnT family glycosyltransferase n=1 Tax=Hanstruepera ponticola TaxID=2042995 RepID=UPI000CF1B495|nr:glycosyltransferase family 39 protein [Hanstruepera ponticola]